MANSSRIFFENRLLPLSVGCMSTAMAIIVSTSDVTLWCRIPVPVLFACAAIWTFWRTTAPRWVVRIDDDRLRYKNLSSKKVTEVSLAEIMEARVVKVWVCDGGEAGVVKRLQLKTNGDWKSFDLPLMSENPNKIAEAVNEFRLNSAS